MSPKPIPDKILQNDMPDVKAEERVVAINRLVSLVNFVLYLSVTVLICVGWMINHVNYCRES